MALQGHRKIKDLELQKPEGGSLFSDSLVLERVRRGQVLCPVQRGTLHCQNRAWHTVGTQEIRFERINEPNMNHRASLCLDFLNQDMGKIISISEGGWEGEKAVPGARKGEGLQESTSFPLFFSAGWGQGEVDSRLTRSKFPSNPSCICSCLSEQIHQVFQHIG